MANERRVTVAEKRILYVSHGRRCPNGMKTDMELKFHVGVAAAHLFVSGPCWLLAVTLVIQD